MSQSREHIYKFDFRGVGGTLLGLDTNHAGALAGPCIVDGHHKPFVRRVKEGGFLNVKTHFTVRTPVVPGRRNGAILIGVFSGMESTSWIPA